MKRMIPFLPLIIAMAGSRLQKKFTGAVAFVCILLGLQLATGRAFSQVVIPVSGTASQNFDGMGAGTSLPSGFKIGASYASGAVIVNQVGGTTGGGVLTGSSPGGTYNFANGIAGSATDRAVGILNSGSFGNQSISAQLQNNTGSTITQLNITFDYEKYRSGSRQWAWTFFGSTDGTTFSSLSAGDQVFAADAANTTIYNPPTTISKSVTITGLSIANGAFYYLKWSLTGSGGTSNGQGLGIDNFTVTAPPTCASPTVTIGTNPSSVSIPVASGTSFTVSGVTDAASYKWQRNTSGLVGGTWVDITSATFDPVGTYAGYITTSTATSNTLTLTNVPASWDGYAYRAVVTNCSGSVNSGAALLNVTLAPCGGTPAAGTVTPATSTFCGSGSTTLTLTGGATGSGLTYQWSSSLTNSAPGTDIPGATSISYTTPSVSATTYYWCTTTCTNSSLSAVSATGTVSINPLPAVAVTPSGGNVCSGGSGLSLVASGAATYSWGPAAGLSATAGASVTANPLGNTTYTVTGTSAAGCIGTTTVPVTFSLNPGSLAVTPSSAAVCPGAPQLLTANGGIVGPTTVNSGSVTIPASIGSLGTITSSVAVAGIPAGAVITGASVNVINFGSQYQDDYVINIKAPNGNVLNLINRRGTHSAAVGTLYANTELSSAGATSLASGSGTYTGTWLADAVAGLGASPYTSNVAAWSSLYSIPNGAWTLSVYNATTFTNVVTPSMQWSVTLTYSYQSPVTWSPTTDLYTDAAGTVPYTGTATNSVYVNAAAAGVTTYTATATNITCTSTSSAVITANPLPDAITGSGHVCSGLTTTLSTTSTGGTWSSGSTGVASIDAAGLVTAGTAGTAIISYTLPTGCIAKFTITVDPLPAAITGAATVCEGLTATLTDTDPGGTWTSSTPAAGTITSATGIITGILAGTTTVTYTLPTGCINTTIVTVNPSPAAITGTPAACEGLTSALANSVAGGTWSSDATGIASIDASGLVSAIVAGNANISYTLTAGCKSVVVFTVNALPAAITGTTEVCQGATTTLADATGSGTWSSGAVSIATINTAGVVTGNNPGTATITYTLSTGCISTAVVTVDLTPAPITGTAQVCIGLTTQLSETTTGGTWISAAGGTASVDASGLVSGIATGIVDISYLMPTGCNATKSVTVNINPDPITGIDNICEGLSGTLSNAVSGGTWSSSNTTVATVDAAGSVHGSVPGTATITYTLPSGCTAVRPITINPLPAAIAGNFSICEGTNTLLTETTAGGTWTSSASAVASIDALGLVTAGTPGTTTISYTMSLGCMATVVVTVNPAAQPSTGTAVVCAASATTLSNVGGGTWSSSNTNAAANVTTGVVSGLNAGTATITYTLPTGCYTTTVVTVNPLPNAIIGTDGVCIGFTTTLTNTGGGTWTSGSSNATVGLTTGVVTGVAAGAAVITYTLPTGCLRVKSMNVSALPAPVTGPAAVCAGGYTITMSDATPGGTWSVMNPNAAIDPATGVLTAYNAAPVTISYTIAAGCSATKLITINPLPYAIVGDANVCMGSVRTLLNSGGGTWTSSNANATVGLLSGVVTGVAYGNANITYTLPVTGCYTIRIVTVSPLPAAITGTGALCPGGSLTLANATTGGYWINGNGSASVNYMTGVVTAIAQGRDTITYSSPSGCTATTVVTVNPLPNAFAVTGSGIYCTGTPGRLVGLSNSNPGVAYQLYNGSAPIGSPVSGTGAAFNFGPMPAGTYTVSAQYPGTLCSNNMTGSAIVTSAVSVIPALAVATNTGSDLNCGNAAMTFTATAVNGGTAPVFNWTVNGAPIGTTAASYAYTPANGDVVKVILHSNAVCAIPDSAVSIHTISVLPEVIPYVYVNADPGSSVCSGTAVSFAPNALNGGSSPEFRWRVNGVYISTGATLLRTPVNGEVISCIMISDAACRLADSAVSPNLTMSVATPVAPSVSITADPGTNIHAGDNVTFTANVSGTSVPVTYQWSINNTAVAGATAPTFSGASFSNNSSISCTVTNVDICGASSTSSVVMHVSTGVQQTGMGMSALSVFPNPGNGTFTITGQLSQSADREVSVEVTDMVGHTVYTGTIVVVNGSINTQIVLGNELANGAYLLRLHSGDDNAVVHLAISK